MRMRRPIVATLLVATLALSACGGGGSDDGSGSDDDSSTIQAPPSGSEAAGGAATVEIADFAFDPAEAEVEVGDTVTFANGDSAAHTATSAEGAPAQFDTGDIDGDGTAEVTLDDAGDYEYYCSIHEYMTGTIRVLE